VSDKIGRILKRDGSVKAFDEEKIVVAIYKAFASLGIHDRGRAASLAAKAISVLETSYTSDAPPTVEDIQDVVEDTLLRNNETEVAKSYIIYRFRRGQVRARKAGRRTRENEPIPYKVLWRYFIWNAKHGVETTQGLNAIIQEGHFADLVAESDRRYDEQIERAAEEITANRDDIRVIIVAGPSSSGKTTTTIKLGEKLARNGLALKALNMDNYFFDLELHPRDEFGDHDFETPEALDLNLINEHLSALLQGESVETPFYDFKTGRRQKQTETFRLGPDEVLLIDCLHGLYDAMTGVVPSQSKFRIYIETLEQIKTSGGEFIRWTDIRLLRRMIRDNLHRAYDPRKTLMHWHYVRRSELKHIIPFVNSVDFIINSSLPYELPVLKNLLFDRFPALLTEFAEQRKHRDAWLRASRISTLLEEIDEVTDHATVPDDSLLREFIGGSRYRY